MRRRRREATANDSNFPKGHYREDYLATLHTKLVIFTLSRCKSAEVFISCCDSALLLTSSMLPQVLRPPEAHSEFFLRRRRSAQAA